MDLLEGLRTRRSIRSIEPERHTGGLVKGTLVLEMRQPLPEKKLQEPSFPFSVPQRLNSTPHRTLNSLGCINTSVFAIMIRKIP
jgi:hypothetical protein